MIDEAAEIVNDPLIQRINKGGGAGLRLTIATQTFADFAARTGSIERLTSVRDQGDEDIAQGVDDTPTDTG